MTHTHPLISIESSEINPRIYDGLVSGYMQMSNLRFWLQWRSLEPNSQRHQGNHKSIIIILKCRQADPLCSQRTHRPMARASFDFS